MAIDLYIGGRGGIARTRQDNGSWSAPIQELTMAVHPLALELTADRSELMTSAFAGGVWRSESGSGTWVPCNEGLEEREIWALAHDPVSNAWFAGAQPAEIWQLAPGAKRWELLADLTGTPGNEDWHFPVPPNVPHVRAIACHPRKPGVIYCGIEVGGVLKSEDGGRTWRLLHGVGHDVHRILCLADRDDAVLVTTGDDTPPYRREGGYGTYLSLDGGESWQQRLEGLEHRAYSEDAVAIDPRDPDVVYLVALDGVPPDWAGFGDGTAYWLSPKQEVRAAGADARVYRGHISKPGWEPIMQGLADPLFDMAWAFDLMDTADGSLMVLGTTAGNIFACRPQAAGQPGWQRLPVSVADPLVSHLRLAPQ